MIKPTKSIRTAGIVCTMLFFTAVIAFPAQVAAKPKVVAVEGISYNVNASVEDNLKSLSGKKVYVHLDSGKTLTGLVRKVGKHLFHLEKLEGKNYFDALIRIEDITAIDTRFREIQR